MVALNNASRTGTAGTLADRQMEAYRALPYAGASRLPLARRTHAARRAGDSFRLTEHVVRLDADVHPVSAATWPAGPTDGVTVDTSSLELPRDATITPASPGCNATSLEQPVKQVTVVVRDAATPSKTYVRETSTFDAAT